MGLAAQFAPGPPSRLIRVNTECDQSMRKKLSSQKLQIEFF